MAIDERKNRVRKVMNTSITIKPVDKRVWNAFNIYLLETNMKKTNDHINRVTKGELIETILREHLNKKYLNNEFELDDLELINALNGLPTKKNKQP